MDRPLTLLILLLSSSLTLLAAVMSDTDFYHGPLSFETLLEKPVLTPINSLLYNTSAESLAEHGLHPRYQHLLINLPLLLAPALPLLFSQIPLQKTKPQFISATSAMAILSLVPHQEPRFLIPVIPLLLSSISIFDPTSSPKTFRVFATTWIIFNAILGLVYGRYHQAGVVPAQTWLGENKQLLGLKHGAPIVWWKTYSPPIWLLNASREALDTKDLMGIEAVAVEAILRDSLGSCSRLSAGATGEGEAVLVVPRVRNELEIWRGEAPDGKGALHHIRGAKWTLIWNERRHVGLDDLDFAEDGVWGTLSKVIRKRGLDVWRIEMECP